MATKSFLALLRGINVGGKNIIPKDELRSCFEDLGFENVRTYIQSGNILFRSDASSVRLLTTTVEAQLADRFGYDARAVVISKQKYASMVAAAPASWGRGEDHRHNALFTLAGMTPKKLIASLPASKPKIESVAIAPGVVFWSIEKSSATRSSFVKLPSEPAYKQVTIRNHNTVNKLLQLFDEI